MHQELFLGHYQNLESTVLHNFFLDSKIPLPYTCKMLSYVLSVHQWGASCFPGWCHIPNIVTGCHPLMVALSPWVPQLALPNVLLCNTMCNNHGIFTCNLLLATHTEELGRKTPSSWLLQGLPSQSPSLVVSD